MRRARRRAPRNAPTGPPRVARPAPLPRVCRSAGASGPPSPLPRTPPAHPHPSPSLQPLTPASAPMQPAGSPTPGAPRGRLRGRCRAARAVLAGAEREPLRQAGEELLPELLPRSARRAAAAAQLGSGEGEDGGVVGRIGFDGAAGAGAALAWRGRSSWAKWDAKASESTARARAVASRRRARTLSRRAPMRCSEPRHGRRPPRLGRSRPRRGRPNPHSPGRSRGPGPVVAFDFVVAASIAVLAAIADVAGQVALPTTQLQLRIRAGCGRLGRCGATRPLTHERSAAAWGGAVVGATAGPGWSARLRRVRRTQARAAS